MNSMTRKDFMKGVSAAMAVGAVAPSAFAAAPLGKYQGALLHLGSNMWDDYSFDPDADVGPGPTGRTSRYHPYLECRDELWKQCIDRMAARKLNLVFIDIGEALVYPSHPELAVKGSWSVEKLRAELARIRSLGILPLPKLNFSSCHDAWLKDYHRMLSTKKYYEVVADLIRDVCEIFDRPPYFHIGFDEEIAPAGANSFHMTIRKGDLWWHDLFYVVGQVEKHGARAVMWSDKICDNKEDFLKRMTKNVVMSPWFYWPNIAAVAKVWNPELEKKTGSWDVQGNLPASFGILSDQGFDLMACGSNVYKDDATAAFVRFCRERLDPAHLLCVYTAPWKRTIPDTEGKKNITGILEGIDQLADALS